MAPAPALARRHHCRSLRACSRSSACADTYADDNDDEYDEHTGLRRSRKRKAGRISGSKWPADEVVADPSHFADSDRVFLALLIEADKATASGAGPINLRANPSALLEYAYTVYRCREGDLLFGSSRCAADRLPSLLYALRTEYDVTDVYTT